MEPNIRNHDILLTEHISPRLGKVGRGDIVIAKSPTNPTQFICKRVVALPGDHLLQTDGHLKHVREQGQTDTYPNRIVGISPYFLPLLLLLADTQGTYLD